MKTYRVALPIVGVAYVELEANSEEEAKKTAHINVTLDDIEEWESLDKICQGNVLYAPLNEIEVEVIEEEDE